MPSRRRTILLIVGACALAFPVRVTCGAPGAACAVPPIPPDTQAIYYYEVEPLAVMLLEIPLRTNLRLYYRSGHTRS